MKRKITWLEVFGYFVEMWLTGMALAGAAWFDVRDRRIPNWWSFGAAVLGVGFCLLKGPSEVFSYLLRIGFVTAAFFPFFMVRVLGAGDVKMMAFMVGCLGFSAGIRAIGCGFLVGAVLALGKMLFQGSLYRRMLIFTNYVRRLILTKKVEVYYLAERDRREGVIPFTVCLLLGFLGGVLWRR